MHILNTVAAGGGGGEVFKLRQGMCAWSSESVRNLPWLGEP